MVNPGTCEALIHSYEKLISTYKGLNSDYEKLTHLMLVSNFVELNSPNKGKTSDYEGSNSLNKDEACDTCGEYDGPALYPAGLVWDDRATTGEKVTIDGAESNSCAPKLTSDCDGVNRATQGDTSVDDAFRNDDVEPQNHLAKVPRKFTTLKCVLFAPQIGLVAITRYFLYLVKNFTLNGI